MTDSEAVEDVEIAVVGAGPAGLAAALALALTGAEVALVGLPPPAEDNRTTALLGGSVTALETLGVWAALAGRAAPLRGMRLIDDTGGLIRAPQLEFRATELGLDAFGWNVANRDLVAAQRARLAAHPRLTVREAKVEAVEITDSHVFLRPAAGDTIRARLVVAADGRNSLARTAAGITVTHHRYPQTAVTLNLLHSAHHHDVSTEFHTRRGPFTLVPLPGDRSSLVCVTSPEDADVLMAQDDTALARELERRAHFVLGRFKIDGGRAAWPLAAETPSRLGARRVALVGEAAHVVPPIGAQGLNLGLRDGAMLAELVAEARREGDDVGSDALLRRYGDARRIDIMSRTFAIDTLNRSLMSPFLPLHAARSAALWLVDRLPFLRRLVMREGLGPRLGEPRLMRGEML
ncbi:UbiH/UbiF family hydroxylase [Blastochloris viridis]|uniref:2-octaprenyl-6-methoxyphenol hydroxylase n=1 Tax=Blastochloris viridis TaxID=1079 RepID=A0A0H5BJB0_BLAVI|nr:UbiH/UbiF family hydroxylase [Blastochloris viridis]ALK09575.1 2-octaprenyl-6-methoxyphenol hydroxylase [Blastochloris viridis]BAS00537.1 2-octaprenyl-6-methoxyphenol hydroxylase [Blastochloris viridis]CUU42238.1 2-octaprenyl-6-methoxyphenol hydroxylase [Blastochloris viridis]